jgi:subtilisin family serine protease
MRSRCEEHELQSYKVAEEAINDTSWRTLMRSPARAYVLCLAVFAATLGGPVLADPPPGALQSASAQTDKTRPRIVVTFANPILQLSGPAGTTGRHYSGGGYLVGQSAHEIAQRVARTYSLKEVASWPIRTLSIHCVVYEILDHRPVATVLAELSKDSRISLAQPLYEFHTMTDAPKNAPVHYNDPMYESQTNLVALGMSNAHQLSQGSGVRIALIDTGVDTLHPDLRGRIARTESFLLSRVTSPLLFRHGTAMAGLIAAVANNHVGIVGIAPKARIEVYEACWQLKSGADDAACNTFTLAKALARALDRDIQLVNLSIAGPADPLLSALITTGIKRGVTFVGPIGGPSDEFPTAIPGVIAVQGSEHTLRTNALAAPAKQVLTLRPEGQFDFESGTSVATAEVTGAIALLMSAADEPLTTDAIALFLKGTSGGADPAASIPATINVSAALKRLDLDQHLGPIVRH